MSLIKHEAARPRGGRARSSRGRRGFLAEPLEQRFMLATQTVFTGVPEWQSAWFPSLGNSNTTIPAQNHPTSGAVNAVAPHPTDPNILLVATVDGGIWRTRGAQDISIVGYRPSWTPLTDRYASTSFSDIVFDRIDPNNNTLWAGIGLFSSGGGDGGPPGGLLRSTDLGDTWVPMGGANVAAQNIVKVVPTLLTNPPTGAQIVLAAGTGAVFRSVDGGNNFTQLSGAAGTGLPVNVVSDVVADPSDRNVFYAALPRNGIYRSRDGGATWTQINNGLAGSNGVPNASRIRLAATRGALFAATVNRFSGQLTGVFRLANPDQAASVNWASMGVPETPGPATGSITAATNAAPIVLTSNNHGLTSGTRVRIAGVNGNAAANGDWQVTVINVNQFALDGSTGNGTYSGGGTWTGLVGIHPEVEHEGEGGGEEEEPPPDLDGDGLPDDEHEYGGEEAGGQGNTHLSLVADPANANVVYIGGDRSNNRSAGNLFRGTFGAAQVWASIVDGNANNTAPHADSRDMEFDALGNIVESDDGGVNRLTGVNTGAQAWQSLVGTLEAHEIYSVRATSDGPVSGNQDTGSPGPNKRSDSTFTDHYDDWSGGDGGYVAWDPKWASDRRAMYVSNQNLQGFQRHLFDLSFKFQSTQNVGLVVTGAGGSTLIKQAAGGGNPPPYTFDNTIRFIQPYLLNAVTPRQMLIGTSFLYESTDGGDNLSLLGGLNDLRSNGADDDRDGTVDEGDEWTPSGVLTPALLTNGVDDDGSGAVDDLLDAQITAMAYGGGTGANANAAVIYAAVLGNLFLRQNGGGAPAAIAAPAGIGVIRDIVLDPNDWKIAYLVDSNGAVFQTNDATATPAVWTNITGDLGNIVGGGAGGARDLRTIEIYNSGGTRAVFVGGSGGVFFTTDANGAHWREFGNFLPNTVVKDLQYDPTYGGTLWAGTWGRGVWAVSRVPQLFTAGNLTTLNVKGDVDSLDERNIITIAGDPNIPNLIRLTVNGNGKDYKYSIEANAIDRLLVEGGTGDDTYNISGLPAGITLDLNVGGGNGIVTLARPGFGIRTSILGTVTIRGSAGGTTRLTIDDSGNPAANQTIIASTLLDNGSISGLTAQPVTYNASANVNTVTLLTSGGGNNTLNLTATGVPTYINFNRFAAPAAASTINIGTGGSAVSISAPVTIADKGVFDRINVLAGSQAGIGTVTLDQVPPQPGGEPFGRLAGVAPAAISFKLSDLNQFVVSTPVRADAIVVHGPGSVGPGNNRAVITDQPAVIVRDMALNSGLLATNAPNIQVLNNNLGDTTVAGGSGARLDGNQITNLLVNASAAAVTVTNNTVTQNVTVGVATSPYSPATITLFQGNTVRGTMTVNRRSRVTMRNNTVNRLVAAKGTVAAAAGRPSVAADADAATIDAQGNRFGVVELLAPAAGIFTGNEIGWRDAGVPTLYPVALNLQATFDGPIQNNDVHNAVVGVSYAVASPLVGNRIFGNTTGVVTPLNSTTDGLGFYPASGRNEIYNNTAGVNLTGRMQNQYIHDNVTGVIGSGLLGGEVFELANLIASNSVGADFDGTIQFNRFARNAVGVFAHDRQVVIHNLIYRGTTAGVKTNGSDDVRVVHNTFYNVAGNSVQADGGSVRVEIINNVFQADGGYAINVADDSRGGYYSDYNDLYSTGPGMMLRWRGVDFDDVVDLQQDIYRFDLHSIGTSAASPGFASPRFLDIAGDDFRVPPLTGNQHLSSPTIDAGAPFIDVPAPPGFRNLLTNGSFETGSTAGWTVNVGGGVGTADPFVYAGTRYFAPGGVAAGFAEQAVDLVAAGYTPAQLDGNSQAAVFGGRVRSSPESPLVDEGRLLVTFLDGAGAPIGGTTTITSGHTTDRWELLGGRLAVPAGARSFRYRFEATRLTGSTNDAFLDAAFVWLRANTAAPDLGAFGGNSGTDVDVVAPHVQVLTPTLYADWEAADPHVIEWQTFGNAAGSPVRIQVFKDGAGAPFPITIAGSTPDQGRFTWIPETSGLTPGTKGLRIQVSLVSDPSVSDRSAEPFALPESGHVFYVNDTSTAGDEYATAAGDNRNTGRTPGSPKPSLEALLRTYRLGAADVVYVDTGTYDHVDTIVLGGTQQVGGDQGVTITGPLGAAHVARINGPAGSAVFDVSGANLVTLAHLTLAGGAYAVWVRNGGTRFTGSYLTSLGAGLDGVRIENGTTDVALDHLAVSGAGRDGISVDAANVPLTNSVSHDNARYGVYFGNAGNAVITANESYNNRQGLNITNRVSGTTARVGDAALALNLGNKFHDNAEYGVWTSAPGAGITVAGNAVTNNGGSGAGSTGVGILLVEGTSSATANIVSGHFRGIVTTLAPVANNRVFDSADAGIADFGTAPVTGNVVYRNKVGVYVQPPFAGPAVRNNLVYANTYRGIWFNGGSNARVENNTVYQPSGDALRIETGSAFGAGVRNNILWAGGPAANPPAGSPPTGFAVSVDAASEVGFRSDYNLLFTSGTGKVGLWEGVAAATLNDWRTASAADGNSLSKPPAFVDADGADNVPGNNDDDFHEQSTAGSFHGGSLAPVVGAATGLPAAAPGTLVNDPALSPALDRGDPTFAYANETAPSGGAINLGAYGNTAQASRSPTSYVTVLQPDGGESVLAGHNFVIRWTSQDTAGTVLIELLNGAAVAGTVAAAAPNTGSYDWAVPSGTAPGTNYFIRVTRNGVPAATDTTDAPFGISGSTQLFYVNDGTFAAGDWTTAVGNDANSGLDPAHPKASIQSVLATYNLGAGDVIRVDAGAYALTTNVGITAGDSGVKVEGYHDAALPTRKAVLTRPAAAGAVVFDLQGADDVTLDSLTLAGGGAAVGIFADAGADSDRVTVTRLDVSGFGDFGLQAHGTNDNWTVANSRFHDPAAGGFYRTGLSFDGIGGAYAGTVVRDNVVFGFSRTGVVLDNAGAGTLVTGNDVYNNGTGISVGAAQNAAVTVSANKVHENVSIGILAGGPTASVSGNTAWGQADVNAYGIQTQNGAVATGNVTYGNGSGIYVFGGGAVTNNRSYGNARFGIYAGGSDARGNVLYNNQTGIEGFGNPVWANNLVYNNSAFGMYLRGAGAPLVINNTVYQPAGDALTVESTHNNLQFQNIRVRNNVLWALAGYALAAGTDVAPGFQSDYNDLYVTGTGKVGLWENVARPTLLAWQQVTFNDANSFSADPQFVSAAGGDFHEQSTHGSFHGGSLAPVLDGATGLPVAAAAAEANDAADSVAIDAGAPTDPATNEPSPNGGFVNLGAFGNTAQASRSAATWFRVTRPNGGESWSTRQTFPVLWRGDNPGAGLVDIELMHRAPGGELTLQATIAGGVANNGRYDWAVPQDVPAGTDYVVRVTRRGAPAISDTSDNTFAVAAGTGIYYVNDATVQAGDWTTAPGDDANSGLDPAHPKATISGVLSAYALGATDVIRVDAGNYLLSGNVVITPADSGVTVRGYSDAAYPDRKAVLDRGSRATNAFVFEIAGADDVTVDRLSMTGAYFGFVGPFNADADRVTLTNSEIYGMSWYGLYAGGQNDDWTLTGNRIYSNYINLQTEGAARVTISGNLVYNSTYGGGIQVGNGQGSTVSSNEVYGNNAAGITADNATVTNNLVHDNKGTGLITYGGVVATGNTVYNQSARFVAGIYNQGGDVRCNTVYGNYDGITMNGGATAGNRVFNNANVGISITGGVAERNTVYSNDYGITGTYSVTVRGNLVYSNRTLGIWMNPANSAVVEGNTVYQLTGDALRVTLDTNNTRLALNRVRDNILWAAGAGNYALNVTNDVETAIASDYNDLYASGGATLAHLSTQDFANLRDWQWELGQDVHSISADPQFVDADGADNVLGYAGGADKGLDDDFRLRPVSPGIDAGDPLAPFATEPQPDGQRANLGHFGGTPGATASGAAQSVQVVSPNGGEKVQAGRPVTVEWVSNGLAQTRVAGLINIGAETVPSPTGDWGDGDGYATTRVSFTNINPPDRSGVTDAAPAAVYQTLAYADSGIGKFIGYRIPVADGTYTIRLHFSEGFVGAGQRKFDIKLQGAVSRAEYDVYAAGGGYYKAVALSLPVTVSGGNGIQLELINKTVNPAFLCGIDITAVNPGGVANPTADVQYSADGGANWTTVGSAVAMDARGRGRFTFTPSAATDNALVRVVARDGSRPQDPSDAPFQVAPQGRHFYVNDASTAGDVFTSAAGNNANSGKSPDKPMATLAAVLAAYDLDPGDVIHMDSGAYELFHNIWMLPQDSGVRIEGAGAATGASAGTGPVTLLDRNNVNALIFDFRSADDVTLDHLSLTGAGVAVYAHYNADSDGVTVTNSDVFANPDGGIQVNSDSDRWTVAGNRVHDSQGAGRTGSGVAFNGNFLDVAVRDNVVFNNPRYGIILNGNYATAAPVTGNLVYGNGTGIWDNVSVVRGNEVHHNTTGIFIDRASSLSVPSGAADNLVYSNGDGIVVSNNNGNPLIVIDHNRVFNSGGTGIVGGANAVVRNNTVYSNRVGIVAPFNADYGGGQVYGNVVYANADRGITVGGNGARVMSNTVYQLVGDAVRVQGASNIGVFGNVLWVEGGADIYVAADGQNGFKADSNLLFRGPGASAVTGYWGGASRASLADWQAASSQDPRSVAGNPNFVDLDGADNVLGYNPAGNGYDGGTDDDFYLSAGSPGIDRGYSWTLAATDLEGFARVDDPGTPNNGGPDFAATPRATSAFAQSGTLLLRANNSYTFYDLPFAFPLMGSNYTRVTVSTEGYVQFEGPDFPSGAANADAEFLRNRRVAPLWDNINVSPTIADGLYVDATVAGQVKFTWKGVNEANGQPVNFSAVLLSDGRMRFDYGAGNTGLTPTAGVSFGDGVRALRVAGYDGAATLTNAPSVDIGFVPGVVDVGAYEFRGASNDVTPPTVTATVPGSVGTGGSVVVALNEPRQVTLTFSEPVNSIDARAAGNFLITGAGGDGAFGTADDLVLGVVPRFVAGGRDVTLDLPQGFPRTGLYRLTVFGSPLTSVHDLSGLRLDGNGDGMPGGDFVRTFTVTSDGVAPAVTGVWVGSQKWGAAFRNTLQSAGAGSATFGYAVVGGVGQLLSLPWSNLDRVSVRFSEGVAVAADDLTVGGVTVPDYGVTAFTYDPATFTATWTLAKPAKADKLLLRVDGGAGGVRDLAGNRLDGDWSNPAAGVGIAGQFPSGNGAPGGDFLLRLNVLAGDVTRDLRVDAVDLLRLRSRVGTSIVNPGGGAGAYGVTYDLNGDGRINVVDVDLLRAHLGRKLPADDPSPPRISATTTSAPATVFGTRRISTRRTAEYLLGDATGSV